MRCNATLVAGDPEQVVADALRWAERGFDSFKLKAGGADDVDAVRAVREALGPDARLRIDANGSWTTGGASMYLTTLEPPASSWSNSPAPSSRSWPQVRAATSIPIVADESVASVADARRAIELGACDAATIKLSKVGGSAAARAIADTLPAISPARSTARSGSRRPPTWRRRCRTPVCSRPGHPAAVLRVAGERARPARGDSLIPGDSPGLGVELDEAAIARLAIAVS